MLSTSSMEADSWARNQVSLLGAEYTWLSGTGQGSGFEGCNQLPLDLMIDVTPEQHAASTPTGLKVDGERCPRRRPSKADGLAEADARDTTVASPEGVQLSPAAAGGLGSALGDADRAIRA